MHKLKEGAELPKDSGEAFCKDADNVIKLDRTKPEWHMSDEAQIVFNILYKKGIKFDCHDFEVYL